MTGFFITTVTRLGSNLSFYSTPNQINLGSNLNNIVLEPAEAEKCFKGLHKQNSERSTSQLKLISKLL